MACITALRQMAPGINLSEITAFLYVAENPGIRVKELAQLMDTTEATASRATRALIPPGDPGALPPGHGWLVMASNPREKVSRHLFLTPLGAEVTDRLDSLIARQLMIDGRAATSATTVRVSADS